MTRRRLALISLIGLLAGCYDLDRLEGLYQAPVQADAGANYDGSWTVLDGGSPDSDPSTECGSLEDPRHCGRCGHDCTALPGVAANQVGCEAGECVVAGACLPGRGHCTDQPEDGCEADLTSAAHCGSCTVACSVQSPLCTSSESGYECAGSCAGQTPDLCGS